MIKKKFLRFSLVIIITVLAFIGYWKFKFIVAKNIADNYLSEKYNDKMVYKSISYVFIDSAGYYIRYSSENYPDVYFNVLINSSLFDKDISISDEYKLRLFRWRLEEEMNSVFNKQLKELGSDTELRVFLSFYKNDEIDIDEPIFEIQKEIPYYIRVYTSCTNVEKLEKFYKYIYQEGYTPKDITFSDSKKNK